jgi:PHP family Zn ribbon phosphoesterase
MVDDLGKLVIAAHNTCLQQYRQQGQAATRWRTAETGGTRKHGVRRRRDVAVT